MLASIPIAGPITVESDIVKKEIEALAIIAISTNFKTLFSLSTSQFKGGKIVIWRIELTKKQEMITARKHAVAQMILEISQFVLPDLIKTWMPHKLL